MITLQHGDCLDLLPKLAENSVDMVFADMPYGTTRCAWDILLPFNKVWAGLRHCVKKEAAIVMTAAQPFTSMLVTSNLSAFAYEWVWNKGVSASFVQAARMPMRIHENVLVFCLNGKNPNYFPLKVPRAKPIQAHPSTVSKSIPVKYGKNFKATYVDKFPETIQHFSTRVAGARGLHPTQKPTELVEYFIKTYTKEGQTVLDFTMGSGTTGVAAKRLGRSFIGIELNRKYFELARDRIVADAGF